MLEAIDNKASKSKEASKNKCIVMIALMQCHNIPAFMVHVYCPVKQYFTLMTK